MLLKVWTYDAKVCDEYRTIYAYIHVVRRTYDNAYAYACIDVHVCARVYTYRCITNIIDKFMLRVYTYTFKECTSLNTRWIDSLFFL